MVRDELMLTPHELNGSAISEPTLEMSNDMGVRRGVARLAQKPDREVTDMCVQRFLSELGECAESSATPATTVFF